MRIYFTFGGSKENLRVENLLRQWEREGKKGIFVVTGYPNMDRGEVDSMVNYLLSAGVPRRSIVIIGSYETFSNVEALETYITNKELNLRDCKIWASTGLLHWCRFKLIFLWERLFNKKHPNFFKISFIPSGEKEVGYALIVILLYLFFTPKGWQFITRYIRAEQYKLCKNGIAIKEIAQKYGVEYID